MTDDPIEIAEYDPIWPDRYATAAADLSAALEPWLVEIAHIGSTSVPGLAAKPVVDIQVGVTSLDRSNDMVEAVCAIGYEYVPEFESVFPERRYFRMCNPTGQRITQVHLVARFNHGWWVRHIEFRDRLRANADARARYETLKRRLADEHRGDRTAYTDAKARSSSHSLPRTRRTNECLR